MYAGTTLSNRRAPMYCEATATPVPANTGITPAPSQTTGSNWPTVAAISSDRWLKNQKSTSHTQPERRILQEDRPCQLEQALSAKGGLRHRFVGGPRAQGGTPTGNDTTAEPVKNQDRSGWFPIFNCNRSAILCHLSSINGTYLLGRQTPGRQLQENTHPVKSFLPVVIIALAIASMASAAGLSPAEWNAGDRTRAEALEEQPTPPSTRLVGGKSGLVAATMSPIAVRAGIETLKQGGTAADVAATVALTQVTTALGSYVSYAGIVQLVYYDASTDKMYSMNAGWGSSHG